MKCVKLSFTIIFTSFLFIYGWVWATLFLMVYITSLSSIGMKSWWACIIERVCNMNCLDLAMAGLVGYQKSFAWKLLMMALSRATSILNPIYNLRQSSFLSLWHCHHLTYHSDKLAIILKIITQCEMVAPHVSSISHIILYFSSFSLKVSC